LVKSTVHHQKY